MHAYRWNDIMGAVWLYTVKLAHTKLPEKASKFICVLHVRTPQAVYLRDIQFTCQNRKIYSRLRCKHRAQNTSEMPAAT